MKKVLLSIICFLVLICPGLAAERLYDVPKSNPARDAVYDLMRRGINVTQGHPDGTFEGDKYITKYEMSYLMANLALSFKKTEPEGINVSDIREEINWLKNEISSIREEPEAKKELLMYGSAALRSAFGNVFYYDNTDRSPLGPETIYRLKLSVEKLLGEDASLKMNLDTMDGGFNSQTARDFPSKLIDIEGKFMASLWLDNPVQIKAIVGPGSVLHRDTSGIAWSEDYTYYNRPKSSIICSTSMGNYDAETGLVARGVQDNGRIATTEVFLRFNKNMGDVPFLGTTEVGTVSRYIFSDVIDPSNGPNCYRQEFTLLMEQNSNVQEKILFGASSNDHPISQFFLNFELKLKDVSGGGTGMNFYFNSVGADYRQPFEALEFVPLDIFNRKILDNTIDIGLEITQPLSDDMLLSSRTDWIGSSAWEMAANIPGSSLTHEFAIDCRIYKDMRFNTFFRYYYVPSQIAQFGVAVPVLSDMIGMGFTYDF